MSNRYHFLVEDIKIDGDTLLEAWIAEGFDDLDLFMYRRALYVEYCRERGIEP